MSQPTPKTIVDDAVELIPLPQAYFRLRGLLADPEVRADAVAEVIATDPALTARLLQIANSAYFGLPKKVDTVSRAISILGNDEIHALALAVSAVRSFAALQPQCIDMAEFWRRSVHCAVVARRLGRRFGKSRAESLFVAGLLHAIGYLLLCQVFPDRMQALTAERTADLAARERETFGFDHAELGATLMERWNLPDSLCDAVRHHLAPAGAEAGSGGIAAAYVHIASALTAAACWREGEDPEPPEMDPVAFQMTGVDVDDIEELLQEADEQVAAAVSFLLPDAQAEVAAPARAVSA